MSKLAICVQSLPDAVVCERREYEKPTLLVFGSLAQCTGQGAGTMIEGLAFMPAPPFVMDCGGGGTAFDNMRYSCF